jgi:uncharacterized protein (DUF58 family)
MSDFFLPFLILLAFVAVILRADFVLTLIYLFVGAFALGRWWSRRALRSVSFRREFNQRAFLGEKVEVCLEVHNTSWLPVVWLELRENLPTGLGLSGAFERVISLGPGARHSFHYALEGRRRGYYEIGPLNLYSGDLLGVAGNLQLSHPPDHLTVYPKIIPLNSVKLPSRSPMGTLRHTQPVFEDPSRVRGKRDYVPGDSLRRVDWKATAAAGRLLVRLFEPSIALETAIFLNLNNAEYDRRAHFVATELAIVVAASLANWVIGQRQAVGLLSNGIDPLQGDLQPQSLPPRRGRGNLMRILELLARLQAGETVPLVDLLRREVVNLSWGTTLLMITPNLDEALYEGLFQAQRAGLDIVLLPCGPVSGIQVAQRRAEYFGFGFCQIFTEKDLDLWRR